MTDDMERFALDLQRQRTAAEQDSATIVTLYRAMTPAERRAAALVDYGCHDRQNCIVLFAWQFDQEKVAYLREYRLRPAREARTSTEAARLRHTDGHGRWPARGVVLSAYAGLGSDVALPLKCDHLDTQVSIPELFAAVERATPGNPVRRRW